jgi:hypothetical protein
MRFVPVNGAEQRAIPPSIMRSCARLHQGALGDQQLRQR